MSLDQTLQAAADRLRSEFRHQAGVADWLESWVGYTIPVPQPSEYGRAVSYARAVVAHTCRYHPGRRTP